jgi:hypothetical protein
LFRLIAGDNKSCERFVAQVHNKNRTTPINRAEVFLAFPSHCAEHDDSWKTCTGCPDALQNPPGIIYDLDAHDVLQWNSNICMEGAELF